MDAAVEVVVVGDALLDVSARPERAILPGADVPAEVRIGCGGQGANVAVRLARRGVRVELVCALGDDAGGAVVREVLHREGVSVVAQPAGATGIVVILVDRLGERTMLSQRQPFAAEAATALRREAAWQVVSGYLLLEPGAELLVRALVASDARRVLVGCAVPDERLDAWRSAATALRPDLLVVSREEAGRLETGSHAVAVTDATGAEAWMGGVSAQVDAPPGPPVIDTTGAGDAFTAALVGSLIGAGWPPAPDQLESALREGVELASAVARAPGAQARAGAEVAGSRR